jgi:hypothetical protein
MSVHTHNADAREPRPGAAFRTTTLVGALVLAAAFMAPAGAQQSASIWTKLELRPYGGAYIPTGDVHRKFAKDASVWGAQASWIFTPMIAVTGNFAWAPSENSDIIPADRLDVFQYDLGVEGRLPAMFAGLGPFAGAGLGGRSYHLRNVDTKTNVDGYFGLGADYGIGRSRLRLEGRDYISRFDSFDGVLQNGTRNDVTVTLGLTFRM